jgi:hypothetical protein
VIGRAIPDYLPVTCMAIKSQFLWQCSTVESVHHEHHNLRDNLVTCWRHRETTPWCTKGMPEDLWEESSTYSADAGSLFIRNVGMYQLTQLHLSEVLLRVIWLLTNKPRREKKAAVPWRHLPPRHCLLVMRKTTKYLSIFDALPPSKPDFSEIQVTTSLVWQV